MTSARLSVPRPTSKRRIAVALATALGVMLALVACSPPSDAELVDRIERELAAVDGVVESEAEFGPVDVVLDGGVDDERTVAIVAEVAEILADDAYAHLAPGLQIERPASGTTLGSHWLRWIGLWPDPERAAGDAEVWLALRDVEPVASTELKFYTGATRPRLELWVDDAGSLDAAALTDRATVIWEQSGQPDGLHVSLESEE